MRERESACERERVHVRERACMGVWLGIAHASALWLPVTVWCASICSRVQYRCFRFCQNECKVRGRGFVCLFVQIHGACVCLRACVCVCVCVFVFVCLFLYFVCLCV